VTVNYGHSAAAAQSVAAEIERQGGTAIAVKADMTVEAEIVALFDAVDRRFGPVTALVNNAGILGTPTPTAEITDALVTTVLRTNVVAPMLCVREAVRRMAPAGGGRGGAIVNIGSIAARLGGFPGCAAYAASKGAIDSMTIGLAKELGPLNIRVNSVRPGLIETDILAGAAGVDAAKATARHTVALGGRIGQPEEVAALVLWLLSDAASYVTGAIYDVSAGR
jgi:NAD(P)-dependent dehydrogenase (short-subunit alcohol dehydrogenase family)